MLAMSCMRPQCVQRTVFSSGQPLVQHARWKASAPTCSAQPKHSLRSLKNALHSTHISMNCTSAHGTHISSLHGVQSPGARSRSLPPRSPPAEPLPSPLWACALRNSPHDLQFGLDLVAAMRSGC